MNVEKAYEVMLMPFLSLSFYNVNKRVGELWRRRESLVDWQSFNRKASASAFVYAGPGLPRNSDR